MPTCAACRSPIPEGAKFCPACGTPAVAALLTAPETLDSPSPSGPPGSSGQHGRFEPGQRLGERYRIVGLLGQGGMGEVYRADDLELGQSVALKFLPDRLAADPAELDRFRQEVRVARGVAHPNVCRTYDITSVDGHVFLVMEYVDGEDLASALRRMGRPSSDKALEIARQLCLGVGAAHEAGVLHRDLKPANVMIDGRGKVRITDFGLAGLAEELSRQNVVAGTPAYMAPEQLRDGKVSAASDIYSLGLLLHEVFTGKRVFDTHNIEELKRLHSESDITAPSSLVRELDPVVERVLMRCLDANPARRPQTAYAVLAALPGGDPLAAALAAGETPSPELVADAGERGFVSPRFAVPVMLAAVAVFLGLAFLRGDRLKSLERAPSVLRVQADQAFVALVDAEPPAFRAAGFFRQVPDSLLHRPPFDTGYLYWQQWSPHPIQSERFHSEIVDSEQLRRLRSGDAGIVLDPGGKLLGFRRVLPDSVYDAAVPDPSRILPAMGLRSEDYRQLPPTEQPGAFAWMRLSGAGPERIRAEYRGGQLERLTAQAPPVDTGLLFSGSGADREATPLPLAILFSALPVVATGFLAWRNLRLGRGDRRGATVFGVIVFTAYMLESMLHLSLERMDPASLIVRLFGENPFGHALYHAVLVWLGYLALEPYLRRTRPSTLVSWARLVGRRWRDPLLGRDVLAGLCGGALLAGFMFGIDRVLFALKGIATGRAAGWGDLDALSGTAVVLGKVAYCVAFASPAVMLLMVFYLLFLVLLRRSSLAIAAIPLLFTTAALVAGGPLPWWFVASQVVVGATLLSLTVFRFGVLAGVVFMFTVLMATNLPWALAPTAWYGAMAMIAPVLLSLFAAWAAMIAVGGRASLAHLLGEETPAGSG